MADTLHTTGKINGMNGIRLATDSVSLRTSVSGVISVASVTGSSFTVDSAGQITNNGPINFTIAAGDVGDTASHVVLMDGTDEQIRIELETAIPLTTEGTATLATGDLTSDL
jgi:hypothetical protein